MFGPQVHSLHLGLRLSASQLGDFLERVRVCNALALLAPLLVLLEGLALEVLLLVDPLRLREMRSRSIDDILVVSEDFAVAHGVQLGLEHSILLTLFRDMDVAKYHLLLASTNLVPFQDAPSLDLRLMNFAVSPLLDLEELVLQDFLVQELLLELLEADDILLVEGSSDARWKANLRAKVSHVVSLLLDDALEDAARWLVCLREVVCLLDAAVELLLVVHLLIQWSDLVLDHDAATGLNLWNDALVTLDEAHLDLEHLAAQLRVDDIHHVVHFLPAAQLHVSDGLWVSLAHEAEETSHVDLNHRHEAARHKCARIAQTKQHAFLTDLARVLLCWVFGRCEVAKYVKELFHALASVLRELLSQCTRVSGLRLVDIFFEVAEDI